MAKVTIQTGDRVRDRITGYQGIVVAITRYLYGCRRIHVQSEVLHDGKPVDAQFFDEPQVEVQFAGAIRGDSQVGDPLGGPMHSIPPAKATPSR